MDLVPTIIDKPIAATAVGTVRSQPVDKVSRDTDRDDFMTSSLR
jgi:hypothetical protein